MDEISGWYHDANRGDVTPDLLIFKVQSLVRDWASGIVGFDVVSSTMFLPSAFKSGETPLFFFSVDGKGSPCLLCIGLSGFNGCHLYLSPDLFVP